MTERQTREHARDVLTDKLDHYSRIMGVRPEAIHITSAKTRWGSCTSNRTINFSYRLIFAPDELIDYVVIHELAHLYEMNHSREFWAVVGKFLPDYKIRRKKLKEYSIHVAIFFA